nr:ionotropic receptor [Endoclita signifer]
MPLPALLLLLLAGLGSAQYDGLLEKQTLLVGGVYPPGEEETLISFTNALRRASDHSTRYNYQPFIIRPTSSDSHPIFKAVCESQKPLVALFTGQRGEAPRALAAVSRRMQVPLLAAAWQPPPPPPAPLVFHLHPALHTLSVALAALVEDNDWKTYTLLYDDDYGLIRLEAVLRLPRRNTVRVRRLSADNAELFKLMHHNKEYNVLLDCAADRVLGYLEQAMQVNMFSEYQSYILTSLDAHRLDWDSMVGGRSNVSCLRMIDPDDDEMNIQTRNPPNRYATLEGILAADAVSVLAVALETFQEGHSLETFGAESCDRDGGWKHGLDLAEHMRQNHVQGYTNSIEFDSNGQRANFTLQVLEREPSGFMVIAEWEAQTGAVVQGGDADSREDTVLERAHDKVFTVVSRKGLPYLDVIKDDTLKGNDRYRGYAVDLIDAIAKILNIKYEFKVLEGGYGTRDKTTNKWNGLIGQLVDGKADMAICDLTITYERRSAVDFTMPFMTLGISILYKRAEKQPPSMFSFMAPFSNEVWLYVATAKLIVSMLLYLCSRLSPGDWENPHPCDKEPEELENIWNLKNCAWLTLGSIMTQGCDILPKAFGTRWITGMWWFFALILTSSYTANLAAFLTNDRMEKTIQDVKDLSNQNKIKYGVLEGGSSYNFFKDSNDSIYQRVWTTMESTRPSVFVSDNKYGVERVLQRKGKYAYFMESTSIEYIMQRKCDLYQVGGNLDFKGYGIALPMNSPYRKNFNKAILKLQETGELDKLKKKWWEEMDIEKKCDEESSGDSEDSMEFGLDNVGGVFLVVAMGCVLGAMVTGIEFLWHARSMAVDEKISTKEAIVSELKASLNFNEPTKPVLKGRSSTKSPPPTSEMSGKTF